MTHNRHVALVLALGALGAAGLVAAALVQGADSEAARQQYEIRLKGTDTTKGDDLFALAKWCYQNGLTGEALSHAAEAHQKAPDDVRAKFLIFALTSSSIDITGGGTGDTGGTGGETGGARKTAGISAEDVEAVFNNEGADAMRKFQSVQTILVRRCGTPSCHGSLGTKAKFALIVTPPLDRRATADNFKTIAPYINRDSDEESRLLQAPLKGPEAGHPSQQLRGTTDPAYASILDWIRSLRSATQQGGFWGDAKKADEKK
jgi:hypothetical protein